jgi:hypothetical protein
MKSAKGAPGGANGQAKQQQKARNIGGEAGGNPQEVMNRNIIHLGFETTRTG